MRVLILHNRYRQPGGEDQAVRAEADMLRSNGVETREVVFDNEIMGADGIGEAARLGWSASWSEESRRRVRRYCEEYRPDVVHVHNFWMKLSPSVHAACRDAGSPTVQTLHNFRLLCTNASFLRNELVCEDCLGKAPWRGVVRRCYRDSFLASGAVAKMIVSNRRRGTWKRHVGAFIALSEHSRSKFIAGGLPADRIFVKPNFVEDPADRGRPPSACRLVLYVGRLAKEKGLTTLLSSWATMPLEDPRVRLTIVGDGPERAALQQHATSLHLSPERVVFAGHKSPSEVRDLLREARCVVVPSVCFENFPVTVAEAYSLGRPLVVSDLGALRELVDHGRTGLRFQAGNAGTLGEALRTIVADGPLADSLGENGRAEYVAKYTPRQNYETLMGIYRFALQHGERPLPEAIRDFQTATG